MKVSDYHIAIGNTTDVGKIRVQNEDYMAHFDTPLGYCIIVCDGMGGHAAGQVASHNAVGAMQQFLQDKQNDNPDIPVAMKNAIEFANFQLREMMNKNPELKGMGTTVVLALIKDGYLHTAHAGDSRIYLIRKNSIEQITKDHSSVQKLIDIGVLTEKEAELSDKKNQISKAIGVFEKVEPAISETPVALHKNDTILLCSDGLTGHVSKEKILETVMTNKDIQTAALKLVEMANIGGGSDNITVQVVHYTGKTKKKKKRQRLRRKSVAILLLVLVLLVFGFIGYKKYRNNGSRSSDLENIDTTDSIVKKPVKPLLKIPSPETTPNKNSNSHSDSNKSRTSNVKNITKNDSINKKLQPIKPENLSSNKIITKINNSSSDVKNNIISKEKTIIKKDTVKNNSPEINPQNSTIKKDSLKQTEIKVPPKTKPKNK